LDEQNSGFPTLIRRFELFRERVGGGLRSLGFPSCEAAGAMLYFAGVQRNKSWISHWESRKTSENQGMTCSSPQVWDGVLRRLGEELPPFAVEAWLRPLVAEPDGEGLRLVCPTPLHRRRVDERYLAQIQACLAEELGRSVPLRVEFRLPVLRSLPEVLPDPETSPPGNAARRLRLPSPAAGFSAPAPRRSPHREVRPPGAPLPAAASQPQRSFPYTFDTFVVGACNALAREAAWAIAEQSPLTVSPLYLVSSPGLGKTHLARAVVEEARVRGGRGAIYASAEQFTSELMSALHGRRMPDFKRRYRRHCDLLVIDDVQFLAAKKATQLELFHTLESLHTSGARVVLTGNRLPRKLDEFEPRLASRIGSGLIAEIEAPGPELRREILRSKAAAGAVRLPSECLDRLVEAVPGSIRDLESSLIQLVASASLLKRPIDLDLTDAAVRKVVPEGGHRALLEPSQVIQIVAGFFGTTPEALAVRSRRRDVLLPRKLAMYLCRRYTDASLKQIGRCFGRDHPAVTNAISSIERAMLERAPLRYQVEALTQRLHALGSR
jgi:chromosomal replication initiator protein